MIRIATIDQTRAIEAAADASGYSYAAMMQHAGERAGERALVQIAGLVQPMITVLVGAGNNGGDGLVAGLHIAQQHPEATVRFYLLKERDDEHFQAVQQAGHFVAYAEHDKDKRVLRNMVASADVVLDALFGIGVRLPIRGDAQKVLHNAKRALNERRQALLAPEREQPLRQAFSLHQEAHPVPRPFVLAIDCPSGLDCDTGDIDANSLPADETVTFITAKVGQFLFPGAEAVGVLSVAPLNVPADLSELRAVQTRLVDAETVRATLPARTPGSHKGSYGRVMVAAGSVNYIGAPALAAEAAYRAGAGLVTVAAPHNVVAALASRLLEATWLLLPHDMGVISESAVDVLLEELGKVAALLIGPGMGTEETTRKFLRQILKQEQATPHKHKRAIGFHADVEQDEEPAEPAAFHLPPLVIDADGLNMLAELPEWWTLLPEQTIITPHPGEMARLCGLETADVQRQRWQLAQEKAVQWQVVLVLKGAHTVIAAPEGDFAVLPFKNDALATAGTGDVLAGLITGFRAQGVSAYEAALLGAYLHGLAGELAAQQQPGRSVIAGDVLAAIGQALRTVER